MKHETRLSIFLDGQLFSKRLLHPNEAKSGKKKDELQGIVIPSQKKDERHPSRLNLKLNFTIRVFPEPR